MHYPWTKIDGTGLNYSARTFKRPYLTRACCRREAVIFFGNDPVSMNVGIAVLAFNHGYLRERGVHKYRVKFFCQTKVQHVRVIEAKAGAATLKDGWALHTDFTLELPVTCWEGTATPKPDIGLFIRTFSGCCKRLNESLCCVDCNKFFYWSLFS